MTQDDVLEEQGVDPYRTPVDRLPDHAQWGLAYYYHDMQQDNLDEPLA